MITVSVVEGHVPIPGFDYWVYVFRRNNDVLYVGETTNMPNRLREHLAGIKSNSGLTNDFIENGVDGVAVDLYNGADMVKWLRDEAIIDFLEYQQQKAGNALASFGGPMTREEIIATYGRMNRVKFEKQLIVELKPLFNARF